ncbi:5'-methylthioadenosine/adenosylhomocysteine nucleosidase [Anaerobacillus sp. MEB173]|uniref:5'-methylthioadenosine/adenosylhomocysteine nucleosidase n=1 Tax=Anaerobacillus sp. MEB173 TaxID=3383345 RepID=UPI003F900EE6
MRIGIIGAMNEEIELMRESLELKQESVHAKNVFYEGTYANQEIVLCKSGVGKVNGAITTQILIDRFNVDKIIFTGVAGAIDPTLEIGDIVISTSAMQHDIDASALGFPRGQVPMFAESSDFQAAESLIALAEEAAEQLNEINIIKGRVLSGDQFIADPEIVKELDGQFQGKCVEMEGAAVAQAAMLNEIPFVIIRSMSDKANGSADVNFAEFTKLASERSAVIVRRMLEKME